MRTESLEVDVSVYVALDQLAREEKERRLVHQEKSPVILDDPRDWGVPGRGREVPKVGILGQDQVFSENLRTWLVAWGFLCQKVSDAKHLGNILEARNRPDRLFIAASQWPQPPRESDALAAALKRHGVPVVWLDGPEAVDPPFSCPRFRLPIHVGDLAAALSGSHETVSKPARDSHEAFRFTDFQRSRVQELADALLAEISRNHPNVLASLWVLQERPGAFDIRAKHGLAEQALKDIQPLLGQTMFASVIDQDEEVLFLLFSDQQYDRENGNAPGGSDFRGGTLPSRR